MVQEAGADAEHHRDEDQGEDDADPHLVHELVVLQLLLQLVHTAAVQHHSVGQIEVHDLVCAAGEAGAGVPGGQVMLKLDGAEDLGADLLEEVAVGQRVQRADRGRGGGGGDLGNGGTASAGEDLLGGGAGVVVEMQVVRQLVVQCARQALHGLLLYMSLS